MKNIKKMTFDEIVDEMGSLEEQKQTKSPRYHTLEKELDKRMGEMLIAAQDIADSYEEDDDYYEEP